jgi:hypothetical protein
LADGGEADVDGQFHAVTASPREIETHAHLSGVRRFEEAAKVIDVQLPSTVGNEKVDRLTEKFLAVVPEQRGHRGAGENDPIVGINDDDRVGTRRKNFTKKGVSFRSRFVILVLAHPCSLSHPLAQLQCPTERGT